MFQTEGNNCLGCGNERIPQGSHICLFYRYPRERDRVVLPFLRVGIETQEHCNYMLGEDEHHWLKTGLERQGVDMAAVISSGQLSILNPQELYGVQEGDGLGEKDRQIYANSRDAGYSSVRLVKDMDWVAQAMPSEDKLLEYEIGLNYQLRKHQGVAICQYNLTKFKGEMVINLLKVHPVIIWGGMAVRNPFYVEPVVMLEQLGLQLKSETL